MTIFGKIIKGEIPCVKILETDLTLAFMDISPLSPKHILVIPKFPAKHLHEVPDESMADLGVVLKRVCKAIGAEQYNILQNNGPLAHQEVEHVHFHIIPKPNSQQGLVIKWDTMQNVSTEQLKKYAEEVKQRL